jgi:hypothetical protein
MGYAPPVVWSSLPDVVEEHLYDVIITENHRCVEQPTGWYG